MISIGKVEKYLLNKIKDEGAIHLSLLDPLEVPMSEICEVVLDIANAGSSAIMVGGSTLADPYGLKEFVSKIKDQINLPVILFPNNISSIIPNVDAIWFMSLLNSTNPYYIIGAQMLGAPIVKKYNIEPLPMAYLILGEGGTAGFIGDAKPIPYNKPEIVTAYALAARYLGLRFIYLEAGSKAIKPVPTTVISAVKHEVPEAVLIVGGGIRTGKTAFEIVKAGADIVVTGTIVESRELRVKYLKEIVKGVKDAARAKLHKSSK